MEVTALCIRLLMDALVLLVAQVNHSYIVENVDAAFPQIFPNRLQFFEYENFSVHCEEIEGFTEWRVMTNYSNWNTSAPSYTTNPAFKRHSGEYWCENEAGEKSDAVNISVTDGFVILEISPRPVMEGNDAILHCRNKRTQSQHVVDFYKNGSPLRTSYNSSIITIQNVSKSDEGLYRCSISGTGESPGSWLAVLKQKPYEDTHPTHSQPPDHLTMLWIVVTVLSVALLLLIMGLLLCGKHKGGENAVDPVNVTYAVIDQGKNNELEVSRGDTKQRLAEENFVYSLITFQQSEKNAGPGP
ncbi:low affinity immunoglobulin gamma Fc region receptor III-B-like isoform X2 [Trachinotus anak]|uniref:low affinity immunoglobulin gamma Fc region receptor III-B-like isoform X2 n=1 Tax=Trachinotus anak TaxID=443729 RepID=UPI0039F2498A